MKQILLSLACATMALTACTSQEVIDESIEQGNVIGFENAVDKSTRADDPSQGMVLSKSNFDNFYVFGYYTKDGMDNTAVQIFNTEEVKLVNGKWQYTNPRYWNPGCTYFFYAYSCGDLKLSNSWGTFSMDMTGTTTEARALVINNYLCDYRHQHDLVYASNEGIVGKEKPQSGTANKPVTFTFKHLLSQISASFNSQFPAGYQIRISNVKMANIMNVANYNPRATVTWYNQQIQTLPNSQSPYIDLLIDKTNNKNVTETGKTAVSTGIGFTIPYNYADAASTNVALTFDMDVLRDGKVVLQRNLRGNFNPNWESGKIYKYNIVIAGSDADLEAIAFETASDPITGWESGNGSTITLETYTK